jgi:uncharacterized damage-inducible protein DinB
MSSQPEVWLRGPLPGVPAPLQPAAHALSQAREDLPRVALDLSTDELWRRPGGAASAGFHIRHIAGTIDRLLTYARGESLSERQLEALRSEREPGTPPATAADLVATATQAIDRALELISATDPDTLGDPRVVGRAKLPSTVAGLVFHIAEHAQRHTGQLITTVKVVRGLDPSRDDH